MSAPPIRSAAGKVGAKLTDDILVDVLCDSSKVSDHHAIIPTKTMCTADLAELPSGEKGNPSADRCPSSLRVSTGLSLCGGFCCSDLWGRRILKKNKTVLFNGWK